MQTSLKSVINIDVSHQPGFVFKVESVTLLCLHEQLLSYVHPYNFFRVYRTWATPRPGSFMRPTFQKASEDLRQTSILHHPLMHIRELECVMNYVLSSFLLAPFCLSLSLNSDLRAVEFFIRDKYEKKKYYSKNVTNGSSVCIILYSITFANMPLQTV